VLGTSSAVSETLKNLVLPGVGHFTIVDDVVVSHADFGHEFFVTRQDIGRPKCEVICEMMTEMNPDVKGSFRDQSIDVFVHEEEALLKSSQLVIAVDLTVSQAERLSKILETVNVPLILIR
jgi:amyloid beta precursor protein binding protein 1